MAEGGLKVSNPKLYRKALSCIYVHTGDCPCPCVKRISKADYMKTVKKVELFFSGDVASLIQDLEREMKDLEVCSGNYLSD